MIISRADRAAPHGQHTPVLSGNLDASGSSSIMAVAPQRQERLIRVICRHQRPRREVSTSERLADVERRSSEIRAAYVCLRGGSGRRGVARLMSASSQNQTLGLFTEFVLGRPLC